MNASNLDWIMMRLLWIVSNREIFVQQVALRRFLRKVIYGPINIFLFLLPEVVFQSTFISLLDTTCFCLPCLFVTWLRQVFFAARGLSLVAARRGYSAAVVRRLCIVLASPAEQGLQGTWVSVVAAPGLQSTGSYTDNDLETIHPSHLGDMRRLHYFISSSSSNLFFCIMSEAAYM